MLLCYMYPVDELNIVCGGGGERETEKEKEGENTGRESGACVHVKACT